MTQPPTAEDSEWKATYCKTLKQIGFYPESIESIFQSTAHDYSANAEDAAIQDYMTARI